MCGYWRFGGVHGCRWVSYVLRWVEDTVRESRQEVTWRQESSDRSQRKPCTVYIRSRHMTSRPCQRRLNDQEKKRIQEKENVGWNVRIREYGTSWDNVENTSYLSCNMFISSFCMFLYVLNPLKGRAKAIILPHRIIWSWYTGRWWVGCYIW